MTREELKANLKRIIEEFAAGDPDALLLTLQGNKVPSRYRDKAERLQSKIHGRIIAEFGRYVSGNPDKVDDIFDVMKEISEEGEQICSAASINVTRH